MKSLPLTWRWDGESMTPIGPRSRLEADRQFVVGHTYRLAEADEFSDASRAQFFAAIRDIWASLPESEAERFPDAEHLRKFALIRCGHAIQTQYVAQNRAEAQRFAVYARRENDDYTLVTVDNVVVTTWRARSIKGLARKDFAALKDKVFDYLATLTGSTKKELEAIK